MWSDSLSSQWNKSSKEISGASLPNVLERIAAAENKSGRSIGSVTLIAVTKTVSAERIREALATRKVAADLPIDLGENYVQEALAKMEEMSQNKSSPRVRWHLIGALQTNKSKLVVGKFETIQSVDRIELAKALDKRAAEQNVVQNILLQVKLGDEPTKGGVTAKDLPALLKNVSALKNLRIEGLMSLPPIEAEPEASRKFFAQLRELRDANRSLVAASRGTLQHLSMGTTHDFEVAIEEGATMVRVGTAIFGDRTVTEVAD